MADCGGSELNGGRDAGGNDGSPLNGAKEDRGKEACVVAVECAAGAGAPRGGNRLAVSGGSAPAVSGHPALFAAAAVGNIFSVVECCI